MLLSETDTDPKVLFAVSAKSRVSIPILKESNQGQGLEFHMKYHILQDLRTCTPFKEKSSDYLKHFHKLKILTNFDVNLTSLLGGVIHDVLNVYLITPLTMKSD